MSSPISLKNISWQILNQDNRMKKLENSLSSKGTASGDKKAPDLKEACAEFESLFIFHLFKEMRATIPKNGFLDGGKAEEIYTSLFDSELAKDLSKRGGIGLASLLFKQFDQMQDKMNDDSKK